VTLRRNGSPAGSGSCSRKAQYRSAHRANGNRSARWIKSVCVFMSVSVIEVDRHHTTVPRRNKGNYGTSREPTLHDPGFSHGICSRL
jgi:hypothetical protein